MKKVVILLLTLALLLGLLVPTSVMAKTKWDLEGWREAQGKWMDGLLWTWYEGDDVPYRLRVQKYDGTITDIRIQHDYLDADGHFGIDWAQNFFIGPYADRYTPWADISPISPAYVAGGGVFHVEGPFEVPVPNGSVLEYRFIVDNAVYLGNCFVG